MITEIQTSIEEQVLFLRESFQDLIGAAESEPFTINAEDAERFLALGDTHSCIQAMKSVAEFLHREAPRNLYQAEEIVAFVAKKIPEAAALKAHQSVVIPESVKRIKASRNRFGSTLSFPKQLAEEAPRKLSGREISVEEVKHILEVAQGKVGIAMQSLRVVGTFIGTRLHSNVSHEEMLERIDAQIEKELNKLAARIVA